MAKIIDLFRNKTGSREQFTELVRPHLGMMYRMAYRWTQNREDAEDLVQEALLKLIDRSHEMQQIESLRPWLIKIVYRCFVDSYRKQARSPMADAPLWRGDESLFDELVRHVPEDKDAIAQYEQQRLILRALGSLNEDQRDAVLLHDAEGYSAAEVADILDISIGTVKSRLHRARQQLKNFLDEGTF